MSLKPLLTDYAEMLQTAILSDASEFSIIMNQEVKVLIKNVYCKMINPLMHDP